MPSEPTNYRILKEIDASAAWAAGHHRMVVRSYLCGQCDLVHVHLDIAKETFRLQLNIYDHEARLLQDAIEKVLEVEP